MTDSDLLAAIKASSPLMALADAGSDAALAIAFNAAQPAAVAITMVALMEAAPITLKALGTPTEIEPIAERLRAGDAAGIGAWADALLALGTMPPAEHTAAEALVTAANAIPANVDHAQISRVLSPFRADADGVSRAVAIDWSKVQ